MSVRVKEECACLCMQRMVLCSNMRCSAVTYAVLCKISGLLLLCLTSAIISAVLDGFCTQLLFFCCVMCALYCLLSTVYFLLLEVCYLLCDEHAVGCYFLCITHGCCLQRTTHSPLSICTACGGLYAWRSLVLWVSLVCAARRQAMAFVGRFVSICFEASSHLLSLITIPPHALPHYMCPPL
jgi:hypothetical protein